MPIKILLTISTLKTAPNTISFKNIGFGFCMEQSGGIYYCYLFCILEMVYLRIHHIFAAKMSCYIFLQVFSFVTSNFILCLNLLPRNLKTNILMNYF